MKIPPWFSRAVIIGYPLCISALALQRITQGQYETALYMVTTAGLFVLNSRLAEAVGKLFVASHQAAAMLNSMQHANEELCASLEAATKVSGEKAAP